MIALGVAVLGIWGCQRGVEEFAILRPTPSALTLADALADPSLVTPTGNAVPASWNGYPLSRPNWCPKKAGAWTMYRMGPSVSLPACLGGRSVRVVGRWPGEECHVLGGSESDLVGVRLRSGMVHLPDYTLSTSCRL